METDFEKSFSGFCRACDQTRIVLCEFSCHDGKQEVIDSGCGFPDCPHTASCTIAQEISTLTKA